MKKISACYVTLSLFLAVTFSCFAQHQSLSITFQHQFHKAKKRHLSVGLNTQYLKIQTADSTYYVHEFLALTDSTLEIAQKDKSPVSVPIKNILTIKKKNGYLEGTGYIILGSSMVLFAIGVP